METCGLVRTPTWHPEFVIERQWADAEPQHACGYMCSGNQVLQFFSNTARVSFLNLSTKVCKWLDMRHAPDAFGGVMQVTPQFDICFRD